MNSSPFAISVMCRNCVWEDSSFRGRKIGHLGVIRHFTVAGFIVSGW